MEHLIAAAVVAAAAAATAVVVIVVSQTIATLEYLCRRMSLSELDAPGWSVTF